MNCINFPKKLHCDRGEVGSPSCQWTARTVRVPSTPHHFYCVITCVAPEFFVRASWLVWCARGISSATTYTLQREVLALAANLISLQEWATQCKDWQIRVFFVTINLKSSMLRRFIFPKSAFFTKEYRKHAGVLIIQQRIDVKPFFSFSNCISFFSLRLCLVIILKRWAGTWDRLIWCRSQVSWTML